MATEKTGLDETPYTLIEHLGELRTRILRSLLAILATLLGSLAFSPTLLDYAVEPLMEVLSDRSRVEVVVVHREDTPVEKLVRAHGRVRFRGRTDSLENAASTVRGAAESRRPIDLVLVSTAAYGREGALLSDHLDGITPTPEVTYLVSDPRSPVIAELQLEGASVLLDPPRPAALQRVLRRAAAAAGKARSEDRLVVLSPLEPFFAYIKIAFVCGLFLACPIWIFESWSFIAPGLYSHEKRFALPVVLSGSLLFVSGGLFAYFVMFPMMFDFLVNQMMPDTLVASFTVDKYLGLLLRVTVAFAVVFELPLALALLSAVGIVNASQLRSFRKYAYVGAFVLGAVLTPADPLSQIMMAAPLVFFYEIGILFAVMFGRRRARASLASLTTHDD